MRTFTPRRTNFPSFKKNRTSPQEKSPSLYGVVVFFSAKRERRKRTWKPFIPLGGHACMDPHMHKHTHTHVHKEDEEVREAESGSPRCHAGCAKGDEGSVPAPFVGAIQPIRPPLPHLSSPSLFPATQMASRRAHFISASYSRPAWRRK